MLEFIDAWSLDKLPPGTGTTVRVAGTDVALFNVEGTVYAIEDACLHQGLSLGTSPLQGDVVTCRGHGWKYDVTTGALLHVPDLGVHPYPVRVVSGRIMVAVGKQPAAP
jgi:nitrite reductase/ring-hydroxylating ferredoxin subunit